MPASQHQSPKSDIEISQAAKTRRIVDVKEKLGIAIENLEPYGHYKAKVSIGLHQVAERPRRTAS